METGWLGTSRRRSASNQAVWLQLKRILAHEIAMGKYAAGSRLPSTRELALTVGINKNTVARAYRELQEDGLVESVRGKGVFVVKPSANHESERLEKMLSRSISDLVSDAVLSGLDPDIVREVLSQAGDSLDDERPPRVAFVECNVIDTHSLSSELATRLRVDVTPLILAEVLTPSSDVLDAFDIVVTPLFHLRELIEGWEGADDRLAGVLAVPEYDTLARLAQLDRNSIVGLVTTGVGKRSGSSLADLVRGYTNASVLACEIQDTACLSQIFEQADVLLVTLSCHSQLTKLSPSVDVMTLSFRIDEQSIDFLRHRIVDLRAKSPRGNG